jgi:hypothetical protein
MLPRMAKDATRISQPGGTGNVGALRIVKAAQRTLSSVDPIGRRSAVASSRNPSSLCGSSTSRASPPVSVGLRTIETGGANLAQCQTPRALQRFNSRCKSPETRVCGRPTMTIRPTSDPRSPRRSFRDAEQNAKSHSTHLPCCPMAAARSGVTDLARPALQPGLILSESRIDTGGLRGPAERASSIEQESRSERVLIRI